MMSAGVNEVKKLVLISFIACGLAGCSLKTPVKGFTSDKNTWVGYFEPYGEFTMSNGSVECTGEPKDDWSNFTIRFEFDCTDGRSGVITEDKAITGQATAKFSDGTDGKFYFGHGMQ